jgi:archaellum component FlaC
MTTCFIKLFSRKRFYKNFCPLIKRMTNKKDKEILNMLAYLTERIERLEKVIEEIKVEMVSLSNDVSYLEEQFKAY